MCFSATRIAVRISENERASHTSRSRLFSSVFSVMLTSSSTLKLLDRDMGELERRHTRRGIDDALGQVFHRRLVEMFGEEARPPREIVIRLGPQLDGTPSRGHTHHVLGAELQLREVLRVHLQVALAGIDLEQARRARRACSKSIPARATCK